MKGLEAEFRRFSEICLADAPPDQIENIQRIFYAGAAAATDRILSILDSGLPTCRKKALLRRCAREMERWQKQVTADATLATQEAMNE